MSQNTQETTLIEGTDRDDQRTVGCEPREKNRARSSNELSPQEQFDTPTKELEECRRRLPAKVAALVGELQKNPKKEPTKAITKADAIASNNSAASDRSAEAPRITLFIQLPPEGTQCVVEATPQHSPSAAI